jgi:hypothetical protein
MRGVMETETVELVERVETLSRMELWFCREWCRIRAVRASYGEEETADELDESLSTLLEARCDQIDARMVRDFPTGFGGERGYGFAMLIRAGVLYPRMQCWEEVSGDERQQHLPIVRGLAMELLSEVVGMAEVVCGGGSEREILAIELVHVYDGSAAEFAAMLVALTDCSGG